MDRLQPKKQMLLNILEILQKYSDAEHRLSQQDILRIMKTEYGMQADRKSVKRNLMDLENSGFPLRYRQTLRTVPGKDGKRAQSDLLSDFYLERDFSEEQLRLLIDSVLFSVHLAEPEKKKLIEKLEGQASRYFCSRTRFIRPLSRTWIPDPRIFDTIGLLDEAIAGGNRVIFSYTVLGTDLCRHPVQNEDGSVKKYLVCPYEMAAAHDRYYLIGRCGKGDSRILFRIERIRNIRIADGPSERIPEPERDREHLRPAFPLPAEERIPVTVRMKKYILEDAVDWFGTGIRLLEETDTEVTASVQARSGTVRRWGRQFAPHTVILEPQDLRDQVQRDLREALQGYCPEKNGE